MRLPGLKDDLLKSTTPLNDDTRDDDAPSTVHPGQWKVCLIVLVALALGWGVRNWSAQNSPQPLPIGPLVGSSRGSGGQPDPGRALADSNEADNDNSPAPTTVGRAPTTGRSGGRVLVHVAGHVNTPGVYELADDARVNDAIISAGGVASDGDGNSVNLAAKVRDGQRIEIPAAAQSVSASATQHSTNPGGDASSMETAPKPPGSESPGSGQGARSARRGAAGKRSVDDLTGNPIDLNTATATDLSALPGIGPGMAARIIAYRDEKGPFKSVDELRNVSGFGQKRVQTLQPLVTAG